MSERFPRDVCEARESQRNRSLIRLGRTARRPLDRQGRLSYRDQPVLSPGVYHTSYN